MVEYLTIKNLKNRGKKSLKILIKSQCYSYKVKEKKNSISDFFRKGNNYIYKYKNVGSVRGMYDLFLTKSDNHFDLSIRNIENRRLRSFLGKK